MCTEQYVWESINLFADNLKFKESAHLPKKHHARVCVLEFWNSQADKANWKLLIESVEFKYVVNKDCVNGMVISMPASQGGWAKRLTSNYAVPVTAGVWKTAILTLFFPWPFVFLMVVLYLSI